MIKQMTPTQFMERRAAGAEMTLLDVREEWEVKLAPAPTALKHIPMGEISTRLTELDPSHEIVVLCRSGGRSQQVAQFLERQKFGAVANLAGGILAWSNELDPSIPQY